jgi:hypothetical protein
LQLLFDNGQEAPLLGMQQAVSPNLLEATRQHVLEEPADKPLGRERGGPGGIGLGVSVSEGDLAVLETEDVSVADGHAEDVRGVNDHQYGAKA